MNKIWDIIQTVIFGPPLVSVKTQPTLVSADRYASLVTSEGTAARIAGDEARPWVDYWRRMGVDDPVAAARACEGRRAGGVKASVAAIPDGLGFAARAMETFAEATRAVPMLTCKEGSWPTACVTVEPKQIDFFERGLRTRVMIAGYEIRDRVTGRLLAETEKYTFET
jgi:hypothetical protein